MPNIQLDELYNEAKQIIINDRNSSASYLQRQLKISWDRANKIIEQLENMNILSKPNKKSKRKILIDFKIDKSIIKQRKIKKK
jgi:S-DNA-T family DNA segregation ATPase FtsK/SpoIIIE